MKSLRYSGSTLIAVFVLLACEVQASGPLVLSHRNLFTLCAPMDLSAQLLSAGQSRKIGLTREAIEHEIEPRLRAADLFEIETSQYLSADVNLSDSGDAFTASLSLNRYVMDMGYGIGGFVTVWTTSTLGTHDGDSKPILSAIALLTDKFLADYLPVNKRECDQN